MTNTDIQAGYMGTDLVSKVYLGDEVIWGGETNPYASMYLTAEIVCGGTFTISNSAVYYSVNDGPWTQATGASTSSTIGNITVSAGDKIRFKGNQAGKEAFKWQNRTVTSGLCFYDIYGNILSLEYGDNFEGQTGFITSSRPFYSTFRNTMLPGSGTYHTGIRDAKNLVLPPSVVTDCYRSCFHGNINMISMPELPAKTPATGCYFFMFGNCESLTSSSVIQLESLASGSCCQMFQYCGKLAEITCLAQSGIDQNDSTTNWVQQYVSGLRQGTFYKHPNATWPTGNNGIPTGWTVIDV